jgi:DNA-binding CsgD family transcriptional regulator
MNAVVAERSPATLLQAVMCLGDAGELLFATDRARQLCEQWNRGLRERGGGSSNLRLPERVSELFGNVAAVTARQEHGVPLSRHVPHPYMPGLAVTVSTSTVHSNRSARTCFMLYFDQADQDTRLQLLSPRERRVALLAVQGLRNDEIAQILCRSRRTVEFQLNSIYRKLDVSSRAQLVRTLLS